MKKLFCTLFFLSIFFNLFSQEEKIKITDDIELIKLSDDVYLHRSYFQTTNFGKVGANGLILIEDEKGLLIDTPWNNEQTEILYNWVRDSLNTQIESIIATHWHDDCIGGLNFLKSKGVKSYANQMTIDIARSKNLPISQQGFSDSLYIQFEGLPVNCFYFGAGHSSDNILVFLPTENILFGGCCIKDMSANDLGNLEDADTEMWPHTIEKIKNRFPNVLMIIPGHGEVGGKELIQHTANLLKNFRDK